MMQERKVILIGNGSVGASYAFSMVLHGIGREIGIIDTDIDKSQGDVMDLSHAIPFSTPKDIYMATYDDCHDANIIVITAGLSQMPGEGRLKLLNRNVRIVKDIIEKVMRSGFDGVFIVATDPVDVIAYAVYKCSGLPKKQVIGTGTLLDSARLCQALSDEFNIDARNINGYILGEHGDSGFPVWSCARIGGVPVECWVSRTNGGGADLKAISNGVRDANRYIFNKKGVVLYGIAEVLSRITQAILNDENTILPVSVYIEGEYGVEDIFMGVPAIVNKHGIRKVVTIPLNASESEKMRFSEKVLRESLHHVSHLIAS